QEATHRRGAGTDRTGAEGGGVEGGSVGCGGPGHDVGAGIGCTCTLRHGGVEAGLRGRGHDLTLPAQGRATQPATRSVRCRASPTSAADAAAGPEPERYADPAWWSMHLCQRLVLPLI